MSPTTVPGQHYTSVDLAIALSIIGGSAVIIIIGAWYLSRERPSVTPASTRNQQRHEEDWYRKAGIYLGDLPVQRHTKRLVQAEKSNGEVQNAAWNSCPLKLFHPMKKFETSRTTDDKASELVTKSNDSPVVDNADTSRL